jgi:hypothetical protein
MTGWGRSGVALMSLAVLGAVLVWNVAGPGVRALLDAEADGSLCDLDASHLMLTLVAAVLTGPATRWALGPLEGARLVSIAVLGVALGLGVGSLGSDSISSLGFFSENNQCPSVTWRGPVVLVVFVLAAIGLASWRDPPAGPASRALRR